MDPPYETPWSHWTKPAWRKRLVDNERAYAPYRAKELALVRTLTGLDPDRLTALVDAERTEDLDAILHPFGG
jgi:hypothetical protein